MADSHSVSVTFRFPISILDELREEADHKKISINALVNQIAASHVEWHAHAAKAGFIAVRRILIKRIFDFLNEEEIDKLARTGAEELREVSLLMVRKHTQKSLLDFMERWIRTSDFGYRHLVEDDLHTYIIQHYMGYKWSYYLGRLFSYVAEEVALFKPEISATKDTVVLKIKKR